MPEDPAGAELPLHPDRAGCRPRGDRPQPPPHPQAPRSPSAATGEKIALYEAVDDHAEAAYVVDTIAAADLHQAGKPGSDFAVMYRTNAQSRLLEEAFLRSGLPYRLVGAQRFYGRREVKDMICLPAPGAQPGR